MKNYNIQMNQSSKKGKGRHFTVDSIKKRLELYFLRAGNNGFEKFERSSSFLLTVTISKICTFVTAHSVLVR